MTALVRQDVNRTFSANGANFTGLPRRGTHEAGRQDFGEFGKALLRRDRQLAGSPQLPIWLALPRRCESGVHGDWLISPSHAVRAGRTRRAKRRSTLAKWRMNGGGPPYHRCGPRIVYYYKSEIAFECASMSLKGSHAYASAIAVKRSYRRVQEAMGTRSAAHRYHLMFGDFVFQVGLEWPGACKPGTKIVPFYDLTP